MIDCFCFFFDRFIIDDVVLYFFDKCSGVVNIRSRFNLKFFFCSFLFLFGGLFCFYFWLCCCYLCEVDLGGMIIFILDYVCVFDFGMFEFFLFISDGSE